MAKMLVKNSADVECSITEAILNVFNISKRNTLSLTLESKAMPLILFFEKQQKKKLKKEFNPSNN